MEDRDFPSFLADGEAAPVETPVVEEVAQVETTPEPQAQEPEPMPEPVQTSVPLAALHEERFKRQETEARLADMQRQLEAFQAQQDALYQPTRDEDPVAYLEQQMAAMEQQRFFERRELSKALAVSKHGPDLVDAAQQWAAKRCDQDPAFNARMLRSALPFDEAIAEYQRDQVVNTVKPDELQAFLAWKQAQAAVSQAPTAAPVAPRAPAQPKSLVSAPSAGGQQAIAMGPGATFDSVFKR